MGQFMLILNIGIAVMVFKGILAFSHSIILAFIGMLILGGAATSAPIFALIAYPIVELIFRDKGLSVYAYMVIGLTITQMISVFVMMRMSRPTYYSEPFITDLDNGSDEDRIAKDEEIAKRLNKEYANKKEPTDGSVNSKSQLVIFKEMADSANNFNEYFTVFLDSADMLAEGYEKAFEIQDNNKIYDAMAIIFQSKIDPKTLDDEQETAYYTALSALLIRYDGQDRKERWESADRCMDFYLESIKHENIEGKDLSQIMFITSGILAKYIEPEKEKYDLIIQAMSILTWDAMLTIFAKRLIEIPH